VSDSTGACIGIVTRSSAASAISGIKSLTLAADEDHDRAAEVDVEQRSPIPRHGGDDAAAVSPRIGEQVIGRRLADDRQAQRAAHRSAQRFPAETGWPTRRAATKPVAPAASATRTIAPRLPGSCTSTAATTSAPYRRTADPDQSAGRSPARRCRSAS